MLYRFLTFKVINLLRVGALLLSLCFVQTNAASASWLSQSLSSLNPPCIPAPDFTQFDVSDKVIDLSNIGVWQSAGKTVSSGDSIKFAWNTQNIYVPPKKYYVLYRIDPRFERPQLFIKRYDYNTNSWISDFNTFVGKCGPGSLVRYQDVAFRPEIGASSTAIPPQVCPDGVTTYTLQDQINDFVNYFNFVGRETININAGDLINMRWEWPPTFFTLGPDFGTDYGMNNFIDNGPPSPFYIYTSVGTDTNQLIYSKVSDVINYLNPAGVSPEPFPAVIPTNNPSNPYNNTTNYLFQNIPSMMTSFTLGMIPTSFPLNNPMPPYCPVSYTSLTVPYFCINSFMGGVRITIGGNIIKPTVDYFNTTYLTGWSLFYVKAQNSGVLDFNTDLPINLPVTIGNKTNVPLFTNSEGGPTPTATYMKNWRPSDVAVGWTPVDLLYLLNVMKGASYMSYIHAGRYLVSLEIGGNTQGLEQNLGMEYMITPSIPPSGASGIPVAANNTIYANSDGPLWIRVVSNDNSYNFQGNVQISMATYNGPTIISDFVYNDVVMPICSRLNNLTFLLYSKLTSNLTLKNIAMSMLTLYIMLYGIYYLAGATQIKTSDLVTRIIKITIIVILFSPNSWNFFNNHLFKIFTQGTNYLIINVIGTNTHNNIFGFLDVIFNKYVNPYLWANLLVELFQLTNGLAFFAFLVIIGLLKYLLSMIEIVLSYLMAFISVSVMIALAPFFISFMLFERTKNLFNNWISTLFNAAILPTILLIFYLLIDDIMMVLLTNSVVESCWGTWLPIKIYLDLKPIGIDWSTSFSIPGFHGIPFWIPQADAGGIVGQQGSHFTIMTSSILFFCYAQMASKLVSYVTTIVGSLTSIGVVGGGVAGQQGARAISGDMAWAGSKVISAAVSTYDAARNPNSTLRRVASGVKNVAVSAGSAVRAGSTAVASGIYHAPKNMVKGAGYLYEQGKNVKNAVATAEARRATASAAKETLAHAVSKSSRKAAAEKLTSGLKTAAGAPFKAAEFVGRVTNRAINNYVEKQLEKGRLMNEAFDQSMAASDPRHFIQAKKEELMAKGEKVASIISDIEKDAEKVASSLYHAPENVADAVGFGVGKAVSTGKSAKASASKVFNKAKDATEALGKNIKNSFDKEAREARKLAKEEKKANDLKRKLEKPHLKAAAKAKKAADKLAVQEARKLAKEEKKANDLKRKLEKPHLKAAAKAKKVADKLAAREARKLAKEEKKANDLKRKEDERAKKAADKLAAREAREAARAKFKKDLYDSTIGAAGREYQHKKEVFSAAFAEGRNKAKNEIEVAQEKRILKKEERSIAKIQEEKDEIISKANKLAAREVREAARAKALKEVKEATKAAGKAVYHAPGQIYDATKDAGKAVVNSFSEEARNARKEQAIKQRRLEAAARAKDNADELAAQVAREEAKDKAKQDARDARAKIAKDAYQAVENKMASMKETLDQKKAAWSEWRSQEARDEREDDRQRSKGDLGDKMLHGVKDVGHSITRTAKRGKNKMAESFDWLNDSPKEIGKAAKNIFNNVDDISHQTLELGRDLKNQGEHGRQAIVSGFKGGYGRGKGEQTSERLESERQERSAEIEKVTKTREDARASKKAERDKVLEQRAEENKRIEQEINDAREIRRQKSEEREKQLADAEQKKLEARSKKKEAREQKISENREKIREQRKAEVEEFTALNPLLNPPPKKK